MKKIMAASAVLGLLCAAFTAPIVTLTIKERANIERLDEPVLMGVPLPEALNLIDPAFFTLRDGSGGVIPCEFRIAATWLKNPSAIRWLHIDFKLDRIASGASANVVLHAEPSPYSMASRLSVTDLTDRFEVNTGLVRFRVKKAGFNLMDEAWVDASGAEGYTTQNRIVVPHGRGIVHLKGTVEYLSSLDANSAVVVERQGPNTLLLKATGVLKSSTGDSSFHFITRLYAYSGSRAVKAVTVIEYRNPLSVTAFQPITGLYTELPLNLASGMSASLGVPGGASTVTLASGEEVFGHVARTGGNFTPFSFTTGGKAPVTSVDPKATKPRDIGWVSLYDGTRGAGVARKYFWEMFPSSMEAKGDGRLIAGLYSARQGQVFNFYSGVSRTFETRYVFFNDDPATEQRSRLCGAMNRLYALAPASWYGRITKGLGRVAEKDNSIFPLSSLSQISSAETKMTQNFTNLIAYIDNYPKYNNYNYGFLRWGDELHYVWDFVAGQGMQADWNLAWNGNYYGLDIMSFMRFVRTADPVILDYCTAHSQQVEDVHQVHWGPGLVQTGGNRYCPPTNHIAADGLETAISIDNPSHHKTQGMFANYYLLGSERALEVALEGSKFMRDIYGYTLSRPGEALSVYIRRLSNLLHSMAYAYAYTKDRTYHTNMWQNWFFIKQDIRNNEAIGYKWQMGLFFEAIVDMYYVCDKDVADSIPLYLKIQADRDLASVGEDCALGYAFLSRFYGASYLNTAASKLQGVATTYGNYHKDLPLNTRSVERSFYYFAYADSVDNPPLPDIAAERAARPPFPGMLDVRPNPFSGSAGIVVTCGLVPREATARVYSVSGQKVTDAVRTGLGEWIWDARSVAPGIYLVEVTSGTRIYRTKAVVLR